MNSKILKLLPAIVLTLNYTVFAVTPFKFYSKYPVNNDTAKNRKLVFPTPPADAKRMFYIQRTSNINTLIYELNIDKNTGNPDADNPIHVYWIRYNEKGQHEELNYIQRKFAYGLTSKPLGKERYDIRFVSYKKFPLTLMKAADGKYHIFAIIAQKQLMLNRLFIKIEGGSFWLPNVVYVEVKGIDPLTGKEVTERFKP